MQNSFICYTCCQKPFQFIVLLCSHLICSKCLDPFHKSPQKISIVKCRCGKKTCCKQNNMGLLLTTPNVKNNQYFYDKNNIIQFQNTQITNFQLNEEDSGISQNILYPKNYQKKNINNNILQNINKNRQFNSSFLKTQPLIIDDNAFNQLQNYSIKKNKKINNNKSYKQLKSVRSNQSMSPPVIYSQKLSQNQSPKKQNRKNSMNMNMQNKNKSMINQLNKNNIKHNNNNVNALISSTDSITNFSKQLKKQLAFLSIQYDKQIQHCRNTFQKICKKLKKSYQKLVTDIQKFYVSQVLNSQTSGSILREDFSLNLATIVKNKYENSIGNKINKLHQNLMQLLQKGMKRSSSRPTVNYLQSNTMNNLNNFTQNNNEESTKSLKKSKSKSKQCALYVAINPKNKKDKVVSYIDLIKADYQKGSKKNLIKKTLKAQKFRVY